jgi:aspartyl-tRNA(Asn)/glutamyl-tRNA(Gln) amidotransferase subunit B
LPELPLKREERFVKEYKIPLYDAEVLVQEREIADFFEQTLQFYPNPKKVSNWIMEKVLEQLNLKNISLKESNLSAENFAQLLRLLEEGRISARMAKELFPRVFNGENPEEIVKKEGISCLEDREKLLSLLKEALEENPKAVQEYKSGKEKVAGYFVGQVMRKSGGRAEPKTVLKLLKELLNEG